MRKEKFFCLCFLVFQVTTAWAQKIELEHTLALDGSMWGTEDQLRRQLSVEGKNIPEYFKLKALPSRKTVIQPPENKFFLNGEAHLFDKVKICIDPLLGLSRRDQMKFSSAFSILTNFLHPARIEGFEVFVENSRPSRGSFNACQLLIVRGRWDQFPYSSLQVQEDGFTEKWKNKVYAVFYQLNENTIPVVTIHPEIHLSFDEKAQEQYLSERDDQIYIDGRVLLNHEIGHLFGFQHISQDSAESLNPELTIMGQASEERDSESLENRFTFSKDLWRYWDYKQLSIYRQALYENKDSLRVVHPVCLIPGDHYTFAGPLRPQSDLRSADELGPVDLNNELLKPFVTLEWTQYFSLNSNSGFMINSNMSGQFALKRIDVSPRYWRPIFEFVVSRKKTNYEVLAMASSYRQKGETFMVRGEKLKKFFVASNLSQCSQ